jgi:hypothetical protein
MEIGGRFCEFVAVSCEGFGNPSQLTATWKSCATYSNFKSLDSAKCIVYFEIKERR